MSSPPKLSFNFNVQLWQMARPYLIALVVILVLSATGGNAQTRRNNLVINLGLSSGYGYPNALHEENITLSALNLSMDYSLNKFFSFGSYAAYTYSFYEFHDRLMPEINYKDVWKGWDVGVRSSFHISPIIMKNKKVDLYITGFFGSSVHSLVHDEKNTHRDSLNFKVHDVNAGSIAGFRYYIARAIALYFEAGLSREFFMSGGLAFNVHPKKRH